MYTNSINKNKKDRKFAEIQIKMNEIKQNLSLVLTKGIYIRYNTLHVVNILHIPHNSEHTKKGGEN